MQADTYTVGRLPYRSAWLSDEGTPARYPGPAQRAVGGVAHRGQMRADPDRNPDQVAMDQVRLAERPGYPAAQRVQRVRADPRGQHGERAVAQPGDRVVRPDLRAEPVPDGEQHLVTGVVAVAVADGREPVHVQVQQAHPGAAASSRRQASAAATGQPASAALSRVRSRPRLARPVSGSAAALFSKHFEMTYLNLASSNCIPESTWSSSMLYGREPGAI